MERSSTDLCLKGNGSTSWPSEHAASASFNILPPSTKPLKTSIYSPLSYLHLLSQYSSSTRNQFRPLSVRLAFQSSIISYPWPLAWPSYSWMRQENGRLENIPEDFWRRLLGSFICTLIYFGFKRLLITAFGCVDLVRSFGALYGLFLLMIYVCIYVVGILSMRKRPREP